mgnify:CR=1 FL=1
MEDTLREQLKQTDMCKEEFVLILVLMEDTLRDMNQSSTSTTERLNPCFNGRYSQRIWVKMKRRV